MKFHEDLYYKTTPQVNEKIEEIFTCNAGFSSNPNSINTKSKRPTLVAKWYRENGTMVCRWETI
ncbi:MULTISPECIES: hypothetical protein [Nostocales]|uniref:Uncharacterized protein n=3 Tax=Nostocales TaxID=1161 RepID=A0A8S9T1S5_9CYAN|nr:hypothetical protein [Tolypothrix bouteillei]KAF3886370.1 hypothetical protein DA73_0400013455 [Tolypothrix bouteillei VB521301]